MATESYKTWVEQGEAPLTPIHRERIEHRGAWRGSDFKSKDEMAFDLTPRHVAALEDILSRVAKQPRDEIRREHCDHPALNNDLARVLDEVQNGRGIVVVRGFPVANYAYEDIEKMYWALGTHFGPFLSHDSFGTLIRRVEEKTLPGGVQTARGGQSRQDLALHTDTADLFLLLCVRQARLGGETQFASALEVHNEILATRPDILPILYRGFPQHRRGEQPEHQPVVTPYNVPIFANVNGVVSIGSFAYGSILGGLQALGRKPSEAELEALDFLLYTAIRLQFNQRFDPGEICVINNYTVVHSRTEYVDWEEPEKKRLLLRLFPEPANRRPFIPQMRTFENVGWRSGIDPVPGRETQIANNEYYAMPEDVRLAIIAGQQKRGAARSQEQSATEQHAHGR